MTAHSVLYSLASGFSGVSVSSWHWPRLLSRHCRPGLRPTHHEASDGVGRMKKKRVELRNEAEVYYRLMEQMQRHFQAQGRKTDSGWYVHW